MKVKQQDREYGSNEENIQHLALRFFRYTCIGQDKTHLYFAVLSPSRTLITDPSAEDR